MLKESSLNLEDMPLKEHGTAKKYHIKHHFIMTGEPKNSFYALLLYCQEPREPISIRQSPTSPNETLVGSIYQSRILPIHHLAETMFTPIATQPLATPTPQEAE